ncbi:5'-nucleotidase [Strongylocentrotus purpuratus]|uniref:5'-nucleotidase n=1 Tax=Strongylocentrotus purpuratus TaxID=7668 RepID=A0A7M7T2W6_STRPU|nr:5'-nucleotidase [Strongylocentrotus purpuratus]
MRNTHLLLKYCALLTLCLYHSTRAAVFNLTILHTNDCHARFMETDQNGRICTADTADCFGGVARRATVVNEARARDPDGHVLFLDAGDQFQGTDWFYTYRGNATAHFMNLLGYDAMVLGNHEFDNGIDGIVPFLQNVTFPVLSCNIDATNEPRLHGLYVCSHIFQMGGERVGVVGYTLKSSPDFSKTESLVFNEVIPALQPKVNDLIVVGINKIIALGHAGFDVDQAVARDVKGVDIVVGGHSNTFLYTGEAPSNQVPVGDYPYIVHPAHDSEASVLVLSAYAYGKYLGHLQVTFDENGTVTDYAGNPVLLDGSVEKDPATLAAVEAWEVRVDEISNEVIGRTETRLNGDLATCGTQECNLGNVMADAMLFDHGMDWYGANIAMTTSGSISSSVEAGDITTGDLITIMPYGNTIDKVRLTGRDLLKVLEVPMVTFDPSIPIYGFLQVSGMVIEYDLTRESGDRVHRAQFRCMTCTDDGTNELMDVDPEGHYEVIMNSYMAGGGGGYDVVRENKMEHVSGNNDVDVTSSFIKSTSPLNEEAEGRIILYDDVNRPSSGPTIRPTFGLIILLSLCALFQMY